MHTYPNYIKSSLNAQYILADQLMGTAQQNNIEGSTVPSVARAAVYRWPMSTSTKNTWILAVNVCVRVVYRH